jgi:hypothetical protein
MDRFPEDFMFELSKEDLAECRHQFGTSKSEKMGLRVSPFDLDWKEWSETSLTMMLK